MLKEQIAASLEIAFSQHGFAEQSVAQLKTACNVSLRTLYKHYTSKEMMIVAALEHRHQRYLQFLASGHATSGEQRILDIFDKLNDWMKTFAPNGCMSMNALAAFPENDEIKTAVVQHKAEVRALLATQAKRPDLSMVLFLLHEGVSSVWPILGYDAIIAAQDTMKQMMKDNENA